MSIVLREGLGRPLTYAELDENFRTVARVGDSASQAATTATTASGQAVASAAAAAASAAAAGGKVSLTGNETVAGVKTFSSSPQLPTPAATSADTTAQTTAGSLAQLKATGWGLALNDQSASATDCNTTLVPGTYRMSAGGMNKPTGTGGILLMMKGFATTYTQIFCTAGTSYLWVRYGDGTTGLWTEWERNATLTETQSLLNAPTFNTSLTSTGPIRPGQYTLATLPSASGFSGYEIDVTNATGGSKRCRSNGSVWQILNTTTTVS